MSKRPNENRIIDKNVLMRVFKTMKMDPLKVFVMKDFFKNKGNRKRIYFNILISFGIIEQVQAIYYCGPHKGTRRNAKGYKFKNDK